MAALHRILLARAGAGANGTSMSWSGLVRILTSMDVTAIVLSVLYFVIVLVPIVQLVRLRIRSPEGSWTTQKIFFVLTFVANLVRTVFFALVPFVRHKYFFGVHDVQRYTVFTILDDLPCDIYFTTYTLLILFWAEVIQHARDRGLFSSERLRPIFLAVNAAVYVTQVLIWILILVMPDLLNVCDLIDNIFFAVISVLAAAGFVVYGGRLYLMLKSFPIESKSRQKKLREVGLVAIVCTACFTARSVIIIYTMVVVETLIWEFVAVYFVAVEILPSALVLYMLRHLPAKRNAQGFGGSESAASGSLRSEHQRPLLAPSAEGQDAVQRSGWRRFFLGSVQ